MVRYSLGEMEERYMETEGARYPVGIITGHVSNRNLNHGSGFEIGGWSVGVLPWTK
jgi:hypothetical protein